MTETGLLDDLIETAEATPETVTPAETTEPTDTAEPVRETIQVENLDNLPEGYVDVKGFAWALTLRNLTSAQEDGRTPGKDDQVDSQQVYAATRGKRWSLPAFEAVTADGTKLGLVIPLEDGLKAWDERPERGTGTGAGMTPERRAVRILRAGKALDRQKYWNKRVNRYGELLSEVGATWDDAVAAFEAWMESEEGKKAIPDNDKDED